MREDHYWEVDGLAELYSVCEVTFRIQQWPEDDPNESSSEEDTDSDPDSNSNDSVADDKGDVANDDVVMSIDDFYIFIVIYLIHFYFYMSYHFTF